MKGIRIIGRREFVDFPLLDLTGVEAKIDTGAYTSSIHCKDIEEVEEHGKRWLCFVLLDPSHEEYSHRQHRFEEFTLKKIKNSFGEMEERYIIKTVIKLGSKKINTTLSLSDRANMRYPVLIGRRFLKGKFIVDVNRLHTNGKSVLAKKNEKR